MNIPIRKLCRDCGNAFEDIHDLFTTCEFCRDRNQNYRERSIQAQIDQSIDNDIDYAEHNEF